MKMNYAEEIIDGYNVVLHIRRALDLICSLFAT